MKKVFLLVVAGTMLSGCVGVAVDLGADGLNVRFKAVTPQTIQDKLNVEVKGEG
jgi:hypothetical protein